MELIEYWKRIGKETARFILLGIFGIFTIFPFIWMVISALKTKAEIMNTDAFFPAKAQ